MRAVPVAIAGAAGAMIKRPMPTDFIVRPIDPDADGPALHALFGDEESCRYLSRPASPSVADTIAMLREWMGRGDDINWVIADTSDGPALGRVSVYPRGKNNVWDAACMIAPAARGRQFKPVQHRAGKAPVASARHVLGISVEDRRLSRTNARRHRLQCSGAPVRSCLGERSRSRARRLAHGQHGAGKDGVMDRKRQLDCHARCSTSRGS